MLTPEQKSAFARDGWIRIEGAFERATIDAAADRVWEYLAEHRGVRKDDPSTWNVPGAWVGLKALKEESLFRSLRSAPLSSAIDDLLGADRWREPPHWGGFLVGFPDCEREEWAPPASGWHVDAHFTKDPVDLFALRVFTFLGTVEPRGGATLVVRGSHRLVARFAASLGPAVSEERFVNLRKRFNGSHTWLAELTGGKGSAAERARFLEEGHTIDGVHVRVDELTGAPGDVVLAHPWILHVGSPNSGAGPRMVLARDVPRVSAREPSLVSADPES